MKRPYTPHSTHQWFSPTSSSFPQSIRVTVRRRLSRSFKENEQCHPTFREVAIKVNLGLIAFLSPTQPQLCTLILALDLGTQTILQAILSTS